MGTHGNVKVIDELGNILVNLYTQSGGDCDEFGVEIAKFLDNEIEKCNGCQCVAALIVSHFKKEPYSYYLMPHNESQDFEYIIKYKNDKEYQFIYENDEYSFKGKPYDFIIKYQLDYLSKIKIKEIIE